MRPLFIYLTLFICCAASGQDYKRTQNWYFGDKAGLSFATDPPTPLINGAMNTVEGCATISDTNGNLLFYSNGVTVWNKNHQVMENGSGLAGHESSTQAALIVPQPGNDSLFYVFTTYAVGSGPNGFRYSIVNLNRNSGLGAVTMKNVFLQNPVCEKLTATKHANGKDIWVLAHGFGNDLFYAYLLTANGLVDCPVISSVGAIHYDLSGNSAQGDMKFSPIGDLLAVCVFLEDKVEMFHFNKSKGELDELKYAILVQRPYSIEFSPQSSKIYITSRRNYFYQFTVDSDDSVIINTSKATLFNPPNLIDSYYRFAQIGADKRIYLALVDSNFIGVINYPDSSGAACGFEEKGVDLSPKVSKYGLPNFVTSYFYRPRADFSYDLDCETNTGTLHATETIAATSYTWQITKSGTQTLSGNPLTYQFQDTGNYTIELLAINGSDTARQSKTIFIHPAYSLDLGTDTILCTGENLTLDAGSGQHCYLWSDSSMGSTKTVDSTGLYFVKVVSGSFCTYYDSIRVSFIPEPPATIQITRKGDTLFANQGFDRYTWKKDHVPVQDSGIRYFILNAKGSYQVTGSDSLVGCFTVSSTIFTVDTLTGIHDPIKSYFRVYPNPAPRGEVITIQADQEPVQHLQLWDAMGKLVYEDKEPSTVKTFHTNQFIQGTYVLVINQSIRIMLIIN